LISNCIAPASEKKRGKLSDLYSRRVPTMQNHIAYCYGYDVSILKFTDSPSTRGDKSLEKDVGERSHAGLEEEAFEPTHQCY
jgi:hypothetical protein